MKALMWVGWLLLMVAGMFLPGCTYVEYPTKYGVVRYGSFAKTLKADKVHVKATDGTQVDLNGLQGDVSKQAVEALSNIAKAGLP